jgi:hypothetical protein
LGQPKAPEVRRIAQRTLSGEVTMVDVGGLPQGRLGKAKITADNTPANL